MALVTKPRPVSVLHGFKMCIRDSLFLELIAAATGMEVVAGPVEASAIGNLLIQLRTAGLVGDRKEMRALVASSFPMKRVLPAPDLCQQEMCIRDRSWGKWQVLQATVRLVPPPRPSRRGGGLRLPPC